MLSASKGYKGHSDCGRLNVSYYFKAFFSGFLFLWVENNIGTFSLSTINSDQTKQSTSSWMSE